MKPLRFHRSHPAAPALGQARRRLTLLGIAALLGGLSRSAAAGGGAATDAYDDIQTGALDVHGLADVYAQGNFNAPQSGLAQLRAFDAEADRPSLGILRLTLAHKPEIVGFRLDVGVGDIPNAYMRYDPASLAHPDLSRGLSYVEQGFITAAIPVGRGLRLDAGKFGTPVGFEDNESLTNWNYSRSLLYLLAEPSYHSGLRLTYPVASTVAVSVFWVNGWDTNILDGNTMRTLAVAASWGPAPGLEIVADYMAGPEHPPTRPGDPALTLRNELDAYARYDLARHVSLAWTGDCGHDAAGGGVSWWGVGGYLRVGVLDWLAGTLRAEHYDDGAGFTTGTSQRLAEVTATVEIRALAGVTRWIGRLEYRRDQSDTAFFAAGSQGLSTHQDTVGVSALVAF